ncbi:hypothetical protein [Streptomyces sp. RTd22]|uniref:hypothetical protein n=1 Tax=Streptomyces sp. RTd22 TaxID=1841249 RepID=UPI0007C4F8D8|nr:hypothetical protein [Streptomyces sp. RTd22]
MSRSTPAALRLFREDYPESGKCPAKAIDDPSEHHVWERSKYGNVSCADCRTPHPEEPLERLTESDLDFLQGVCDATGPLYAGRLNAATGFREFHGIELFDDEEGEDLTFYLVAREAMPMLIKAYRELVQEPGPLQMSDVPDRLVRVMGIATGLPEVAARAVLSAVLPMYRGMVIDELRYLAGRLSGVERGVANGLIASLLDSAARGNAVVQEAA